MHGFSEKETANAIGASVHTVHCHVTAIYRHFAVCSRAELLARMLVMVMCEMAQEMQALSASHEAFYYGRDSISPACNTRRKGMFDRSAKVC